MFGFAKKSPPPLCPANRGIGVEGKVAFCNARKEWTETFNTVSLLAVVLERSGYIFTRQETWLEHTDSGFILLPQLADFQPLEDGGVRTTTTIQTNHPVLCPSGIFEFQHSTGDNMENSIQKGIEQWVEADLVPLLEALQAQPKTCTSLKMSIPAIADGPTRLRRAVLGPVMHFVQNPVQQASSSPDTSAQKNTEGHPFCPCCMLTQSFDAFKVLFEADAFYGLRLFALRDLKGVSQADCRVNGEDWEPGAAALTKYVDTWPQAGCEVRKQYVVLQTITE